MRWRKEGWSRWRTWEKHDEYQRREKGKAGETAEKKEAGGGERRRREFLSPERTAEADVARTRGYRGTEETGPRLNMIIEHGERCEHSTLWASVRRPRPPTLSHSARSRLCKKYCTVKMARIRLLLSYRPPFVRLLYPDAASIRYRYVRDKRPVLPEMPRSRDLSLWRICIRSMRWAINTCRGTIVWNIFSHASHGFEDIRSYTQIRTALK